MSNLTIIILISLLLLIAIVIFRIFVRADYLRKGRLTFLSRCLQFIVFFLHALTSYLFLDSNLNHVHTENVIFILAILCMAVGILFCLIGMTGLGWNDTLGSEVSGLKQSGLYRYSRNPQLVFYFLFYIGYVLLWPSLSGLIWLGIYWIISHIMIRTEEEHLFRIFGDEYQRYCKKTPRYIFSLTGRD